MAIPEAPPLPSYARVIAKFVEIQCQCTLHTDVCVTFTSKLMWIIKSRQADETIDQFEKIKWVASVRDVVFTSVDERVNADLL